MTITISAEDPRSIKAIEIAATSGQWLKCHARRGLYQKAFGIPSSHDSSHYYLVTQTACTCQDAVRHPGEPCSGCAGWNKPTNRRRPSPNRPDAAVARRLIHVWPPVRTDPLESTDAIPV